MEEATRAEPEVEQAVFAEDDLPDRERREVTEDAGERPPPEAVQLVVLRDLERRVLGLELPEIRKDRLIEVRATAVVLLHRQNYGAEDERHERAVVHLPLGEDLGAMTV
jgi:hypothetical protein